MEIEHDFPLCGVQVLGKDGHKYILNAFQAPHECSVPNCPGNVNRRKLEMFDRYKKALEGLTPGGSEFVDDPERCATFVREARESQARGMQMWAKRAHANETKLELWDEMLAALDGTKQLLLECGWAVSASPTKQETYEALKRVIAKAKELK